MTDPQKDTIEKAFTNLRSVFPGLSDKQIIEGPLAQHVLGDLPPWSNLKTHKLTNVTTVLRGAFVLCWHRDASGAIDVVMGARPKAGSATESLYNASGGGFANPDYTDATAFVAAAQEGEQPPVSAARELCEEVCNAGGPILDLDPARFVLLDGGVDNRAQKKGGLSTDWYGFACELNDAEFAAITQHADRLAKDPAYLAECKEASHGETAFMAVMKLQDAQAIPLAEFAHPHEKSVITRLNAQMLQGNNSKPANKQPKI